MATDDRIMDAARSTRVMASERMALLLDAKCPERASIPSASAETIHPGRFRYAEFSARGPRPRF